MRLIWDNDGVRIFEPVHAYFKDGSLIVEGTATGKSTSFTVQWMATVTDKGWYITIYRVISKVGEIEGATFNLPLEIANAIKRLC